jgi:hypothetical protein
MQRGCFALATSIAQVTGIEARMAFGAQRRHPVDRCSSEPFTPMFSPTRTRLLPSKTMRVRIGVGPSMAQAFFAASGLTCLTFVMPTGSGGM